MIKYSTFQNGILAVLHSKGIKTASLGERGADPHFGEGEWFALLHGSHRDMLYISKDLVGRICFIRPLPVSAALPGVTEDTIRALCCTLTENRPHAPIIYGKYDEGQHQFLAAVHHGALTVPETFKFFFDIHFGLIQEAADEFFIALDGVAAAKAALTAGSN